jgi:hypothetical protein
MPISLSSDRPWLHGASHPLSGTTPSPMRRSTFLKRSLMSRGKTLGELDMPRVFTDADLMDQSWPSELSKNPDANVSTWALHDLGGQQAVADVYTRCFEQLPVGGVLVNGDFIKPDGTTWEYEPGRFEIDLHLELLRAAGFKAPQSLGPFGTQIPNSRPLHRTTHALSPFVSTSNRDGYCPTPIDQLPLINYIQSAVLMRE